LIQRFILLLEDTQEETIRPSKNKSKVNSSSGSLAGPIISRIIFRFQSAKFVLLNSESKIKNNEKIEVGLESNE